MGVVIRQCYCVSGDRQKFVVVGESRSDCLPSCGSGKGRMSLF